MGEEGGMGDRCKRQRSSKHPHPLPRPHLHLLPHIYTYTSMHSTKGGGETGGQKLRERHTVRLSRGSRHVGLLSRHCRLALEERKSCKFPWGVVGTKSRARRCLYTAASSHTPEPMTHTPTRPQYYVRGNFSYNIALQFLMAASLREAGIASAQYTTPALHMGVSACVSGPHKRQDVLVCLEES